MMIGRCQRDKTYKVAKTLQVTQSTGRNTRPAKLKGGKTGKVSKTLLV
jgi:uncharacterized pyridoxal phosphate-containing UPF0001 family protein